MFILRKQNSSLQFESNYYSSQTQLFDFYWMKFEQRSYKLYSRQYQNSALKKGSRVFSCNSSSIIHIVSRFFSDEFQKSLMLLLVQYFRFLLFYLNHLRFFYMKLGFWPKPQTFLGRGSFEAIFFFKKFMILVEQENQVS